VKWFPSDWLSEPGLSLCDVATQGVWANALNAMMLMGTAEISGTIEQLARLCRCRPQQIQVAEVELKKFNVAVISHSGDSITIANRRRVRELEIKELRRKAGSKGLAKRWQTPPEKAMANSAYASSTGEEEVQEGKPANNGHGQPPNEKEFRAYCSMRCMSDTQALACFAYYSARHWLDRNGHVMDWKWLVISWLTRNRGKQEEKDQAQGKIF